VPFYFDCLQKIKCHLRRLDETAFINLSRIQRKFCRNLIFRREAGLPVDALQNNTQNVKTRFECKLCIRVVAEELLAVAVVAGGVVVAMVLMASLNRLFERVAALALVFELIKILH
jgi:hypothetical protein